MPPLRNGYKNFKVIQNAGFLPDHPQNWITYSLCHARYSLKILERSVHNFLSYLANTHTHTDRQTDRQTKTGKNITSLAEVKNKRGPFYETSCIHASVITGQLCSGRATRKTRRQYAAKWTESETADWPSTCRTRRARRWPWSSCWSACRPTRTCWTWAGSWWPRSDATRIHRPPCTASCRALCCCSERTRTQPTYVYARWSGASFRWGRGWRSLWTAKDLLFQFIGLSCYSRESCVNNWGQTFSSRLTFTAYTAQNSWGKSFVVLPPGVTV